MTGGAGARACADVVIVAEQLRRRVPGGIGTYVSGLLTVLKATSASAGVAVGLVASRVRSPDPLERFGYPVRALPIPPRLMAKAWDLGRGRVEYLGLAHATSFAMPPSAAKLVVTVHDLAFWPTRRRIRVEGSDGTEMHCAELSSGRPPSWFLPSRWLRSSSRLERSPRWCACS